MPRKDHLVNPDRLQVCITVAKDPNIAMFDVEVDVREGFDTPTGRLRTQCSGLRLPWVLAHAIPDVLHELLQDRVARRWGAELERHVAAELPTSDTPGTPMERPR